MSKFEELKKSTSWENFFYSLNKINFDEGKYNEEIELIVLEIDKFKDMDGYIYHIILFIIKIKQKLLEEMKIDSKRKAYFYKREQIDKLYELVLNEDMDRDSLISSLFILDIESVDNNEITKPLLEMIRKYEIDKLLVPEDYSFDYGITVACAHDFLINFGLVIKNLLENEYIDIQEIVVIFIKYILSFTKNLDIYNNIPIYILDGIQLIFDIKKVLRTKSDKFNALYLDIVNIAEQYLVLEYLLKKDMVEEENEVNDDYYKITKDVDNLISQVEYDENLLAMNIDNLIANINQKFLNNNKETLLCPIVSYFLEMFYLEEISPLDMLIRIYKKKLPKYKINFVEELILKNSFLEDLFRREEYDLVIKKYEQIYNEELPTDRGYFEVAYSYSELNKIEKAEELYLYCIELGQGTASVYNNLGCIYSKKGDNEKALEYFENAHKLDKNKKKYIRNVISVEKEIFSNKSKSDLDSKLWEDVDSRYIPSDLTHLTVEEIKNLLRSYYTDEKNIGDLIDEYNLNVSNSTLYLLFPPIVHKTKFCIHCNSPMITKRPSKSSYNINNLPNLGATCPKCKHEFYEDNCKCDTCIFLRKEREKAEEIEQRRKINNIHDLNKLNPRKYEDLNIYEKLYLTALAREGLDEDLRKIKPISMFDRRLAPTTKYAISIGRYLSNNNIISPHPDSPISAFEKGENFPYSYYIDEVYYHINLTSDKYCNKELLQRVLNPMEEDIVADIETLYNIWIEIAVEECKENLIYNMDAVGFNYDIGEKTEMLFEDLLRNFSLGQIFYMNYKGANDSLRFYTEKNPNKKHASNTVIGNIQKYAERVIANGWDVINYNRPYKTPQTAISEIFFNRYLKIEQRGFYEIPSFDVIKARRNED